jgi:hypothetical protein
MHKVSGVVLWCQIYIKECGSVYNGTSLTYKLQSPRRGCIKIRKYVRDKLHGQSSDDVELEGSCASKRLDEPPLVWRQLLNQSFQSV